MDEVLENPISTDEKIPVKDLLDENKQTGENRQVKEKKKKSIMYYVGLGFLMIVLVIFGLMFGFYLRNSQSVPTPEAARPTPTIIEELKEASPATTIEVITDKITTLENKLNNDNFLEEELLPPAMDFNLEELLIEIE